MMAKIEWAKSRNTSAPYGVTVPGPLAEVSFMVKDSKRFPDTNGWGYTKLKYDAASRTFAPLKIEASETKTLCHNCHIGGAKARDERRPCAANTRTSRSIYRVGARTVCRALRVVY